MTIGQAKAKPYWFALCLTDVFYNSSIILLIVSNIPGSLFFDNIKDNRFVYVKIVMISSSSCIDSISFNLLQKHRIHVIAKSDNIYRLTKELLQFFLDVNHCK